MPAAMLNNSLVRCVAEPRPAVAYENLAGLATSRAPQLGEDFTPSDGCTTRMLAVSACGPTATRSLPNSYRMVLDSDR